MTIRAELGEQQDKQLSYFAWAIEDLPTAQGFARYLRTASDPDLVETSSWLRSILGDVRSRRGVADLNSLYSDPPRFGISTPVTYSGLMGGSPILFLQTPSRYFGADVTRRLPPAGEAAAYE